MRKAVLALCGILSIIVAYAQTPTANFTATITSGCAPLIVDFQDQSLGSPTSWFWDFGNGATSTLKNPSTTYFSPGTYTITLTVTNVSGSNTLTRTAYITVYGKPAAAFKVSDSAGCFPLYAQFTDMSFPAPGTNNTSWFWDFGDGAQSNQQNPLHIYTASGNYSVTMKVTNDKGCFAVLTKPVYIQVTTGVKAQFTNSFTNVCQPPYLINFTNQSTGPGNLTYYWNFGDGNNSTVLNPSNTYTASGQYTVSLAVTSDQGCSDTLTMVNLLNFLPIHDSISGPDSVCINAPASFMNASTPAPQSSSWTFGDGTGSTLSNPVKIWNTAGVYTVRLVNTFSYCIDSAVKTVRVLPRPVAAFRVSDSTSCKPPLTVNFTDLSSNAVAWQWDFGDGGTSSQQNPAHTYTSYGSFDVQLIVTNASGCTDTIRHLAQVRIQKPVISFLNLPQRGCIPYNASFSASVNTLDNVTSYTWNLGDGNSGTGATQNHTYTVQGDYTVSVVITTSTGCTDSLIMPGAIRVGRKPLVNFSAAPNPVCAFQPVQFTDLTNEADEWIWHFGDGSTSTQQNPQHTYSDTGLFTVRLIATNFGCIDSFRINNYIRVKPPIARFNFQTNCGNRLQIAFKDSSISATSWFWEFGDGTTSTQQNPVHVFPAYGVYTVKLTVSNDTCQHSTTQVIRVINENPDFTVNSTNACRVANLLFTATNINPANLVSYNWDFGNGTLSTTAINATNTYANSGTYTVSLVTTDIYGCRDTVTKPNYIRIDGPVAGFTSSNTNGCKGLTATFTSTSTSDGIHPIVSWQWIFGDGASQTQSNGNPAQHIYNIAGTYTVKLIVTDNTGCRDSMTVADLVHATAPQAAFQVDTLSCPGSPANFINTSNGLNFTSNWSFGDGGSSNQASPSHIYTANGYYTIKLVITDQYGCADSVIRPDYVRIDRPVASFDMSDSVSSCAPFQVQYTNTSHYYNSFVWTLTTGSSSLPSPTQYFVTPGTYPVKLTVTSPGGCMDSLTRYVQLFDTSGTRLTYTPLNGCKPLAVDLAAFTPGPATYTWDFGDGTLLNTTLDTLTHIYNFFGDFIPKIIMTDPSGCIIPVTGVDTIHIIGATAKFGLDKKFFCDSGRVQFIDSTTFNDPIISYQWNFGDGSGSNVQVPSHQYTSPGIYTISLNVQTQSGCVDTFRLKDILKIVQSPLAAIGGDSVVCLNEFMQHTGLLLRTDTSIVKWSWKFPNGGASSQQLPPPQLYTPAGNFFVYTVATNSSGCADTVIRPVRVNPLPVIGGPSSIVKQAGFPVTLPMTYDSSVASYLWLPNKDLNCNDCALPVTTTKFNTTYTVSVTDTNGCKSSRPIDVIVLCKNANVFLPNTFSPNGDGSNDIFYIRGRGLERVKSLRIFNRWGEVVFEVSNLPVNDPAYGWNGRFKGKPALPDVYVYQVEVFCENSQVIRFEGNVALIQ